MRVVLVVPSFPKLSESFIVRKVAGLLGCGIDVHVVCSRSDDEEWQRFPELAEFPDIRARVHLSVPVRPRWKALVRGPIAVAAAAVARPVSVLRYGRYSARHLVIDSPMISLAPDIVHFEFGALAVGRMHIGELLGCKVVVSFRGYDLNFSGLEEEGYYDEVWERADVLHLLGQDLWKRAIARGCPEDKKHRLIPPAVDLEFWSGERAESNEILGTPDRPLRILSVGRLEWKKGHEYALLAVRELVELGLVCQYEIVGDGTAFESLSFARSQLGLEEVVSLQGSMGSDSVRTKMLASDVLLHSAVSEGFCNAVVEAQAMNSHL